MSKILLGYEHKQYTNKDGRVISGFEIYFGQSVDEESGSGYKPKLRYRQDKKQFQNWFVSDDTFSKMGQLSKLIGKPVEFYTDPDFGNIVSIIGQ